MLSRRRCLLAVGHPAWSAEGAASRTTMGEPYQVMCASFGRGRLLRRGQWQRQQACCRPVLATGMSHEPRAVSRAQQPHVNGAQRGVLVVVEHTEPHGDHDPM
jgi:hypothetical protein